MKIPTLTIAEACKTIPKLYIPKEESLEAKIRKFYASACDAKTEVEKVQFELNLRIIEIKLKSQPSTPTEVKEQQEAIVKDGVVAIDVVAADCTALYQKSMEVFTCSRRILTCIG